MRHRALTQSVGPRGTLPAVHPHVPWAWHGAVCLCGPSLAELTHWTCLQDSLASPIPWCPQVSEGPVLVLQPASGLHFPAVEVLREAILSRALAGTRAGTRWAAAPRAATTLCARHPALAFWKELTLSWVQEVSGSSGYPLSACMAGWSPAFVPKEQMVFPVGCWYLGEKRGLFSNQNCCCTQTAFVSGPAITPSTHQRAHTCT